MWDSATFGMDFKPAQVEAITGYSASLQRKWAERHFDFRGSQSVVGGEGKHRWYSWVGVQMLTLFGDVLTDLGSATEARAALMVDPVPGLTRHSRDLFEQDWRDRPRGGDIVLVRDFGAINPLFLTSSTSNLSLPSRGYVYNLSALQRRLAERAESAIGIRI